MRVLMLSKALIVGAYQRKAEAIAANASIDLEVVVPPRWVDNGVERRLERKHLRGYSLTETPIRRPGDFHLHHYPKLPRIIRASKPDLVHIDEEPYNLATFLALRAARKVGAKTLFFTWQNLNRRYPPPFRWMERYVYRKVDGAIAGNADAVAVLRAKGYEGPVWVLPQFGVDEAVFHPSGWVSRPNNNDDDLKAADPRFADDRDPFVTLGYAGRLVKSKGIDLLLQALAGIPVEAAGSPNQETGSAEPSAANAADAADQDGDSGPAIAAKHAIPWQLRIVGEGPERASLESLARSLGIAERVCFEGWAGSDAMPNFYRSLDLFVLPSRSTRSWVEQFGRVLIEAMASGAVCVGSNSGEIPTVIGDAGAVFPEDDLAALRQTLAPLMQDPSRRAALSRAGRQRVLEHFTMDRIAQASVDIYREILQHP